MRLDPASRIAGVPILEVRALLRRVGGGSVTVAGVAGRMQLDDRGGQRLVAALLADGYLQPEPFPPDPPHYRLTVRGSAVCGARAGPPIRRATAARHLAAFLERVVAINQPPPDDPLPVTLYVVRTAVVFGSFLDQDRPTVGDVDVAVKLEDRHPGRELRSQAARAYCAACRAAGVSLPRDWLAQLYWPHEHVMRRLKAGSQVLSVHDLDREAELLAQVPAKIVYDRSSGIVTPPGDDPGGKDRPQGPEQ